MWKKSLFKDLPGDEKDNVIPNIACAVKLMIPLASRAAENIPR